MSTTDRTATCVTPDLRTVGQRQAVRRKPTAETRSTRRYAEREGGLRSRESPDPPDPEAHPHPPRSSAPSASPRSVWGARILAVAFLALAGCEGRRGPAGPQGPPGPGGGGGGGTDPDEPTRTEYEVGEAVPE